MNSNPNQITTTTSRLNNAEPISSSYSLSGIVEKTVSPRHKNTTTKLKEQNTMVNIEL